MPRQSSRTTRIAALTLGAATALAAALVWTDPGAAAAPSASTASNRSTPAVGRWNGQAAIDRLGSRLPVVAAANRKSADELRRLLLTDRSLHVDASDALLYVDEPVRTDAISATATWGPYDPDTTIPDADTFALHSKPGSTKVIYLDFKGELITGTAWNGSIGGDCQAEEFDFDANDTPGTFTVAELASIKSIWKRVAEDYAPFDVDVTTEDPGAAAINRSSSSDNLFGSRALITTSTQPCFAGGPTLYAAACGSSCGGVAYVGVFNSTSNGYYQPALVFTNGTGGGSYPKYVAEATSHEVGHNIGLNHDGTATTGYYSGQGSWAPIMGVGYYLPIAQWSKGEYTGANNTQDDFAVAGTYGLPLRADDHGNTAATATGLSGTTVSLDGVISTAADVDAFAVYAGAGTATFAVNPAPTSPNLDVRLELRDASGTLLAADDTASGGSGDTVTGMSASISYTFATSGTYTLLVDGVGSGTATDTGYSDYGSVGVYRLTGTVPSGAPGPTVVTATLPGGTTATAYSQTLTATGGTTPYTWSIPSGTLPAGLTLTAATGVISGTPTTAATSSFTVRVTDAGGAFASAGLSIVVAAPLSISTASLAAATTGTAYSRTLTATGGTTPYAWAVTVGTLPAGLALDAATGVISGTPTTAGTSSFTVGVTDAGSRSASKALSIAVGTPVAVTTASLANGTVGTAYSRTLTASGGTGTYTWARTAGALPGGLSLSSAGVISGTPTAVATNPTTSTFTVQATDGATRTATATLSITVYTALSITTASLPAGPVNVAYSATLAASGGRTAYTWAVASGALPAGLTLTASTGVISGTPTTAGTSSVTMRVTDADARTTTKALSIVIGTRPGTFAKSSPANNATGVSRTAKLSWAAASGATSYKVCIVASATVPTAGSFTCTAFSTTSRSYGPTMTAATTYQWQVQAVNAYGTTLANSGTWWTFRTA